MGKASVTEEIISYIEDHLEEELSLVLCGQGL